MKTSKVAVFLVMGVSLLAMTGCTLGGIDACELLNLSYFECLALGL